jgi:outer membrane protein assembly factor BamD (BamD/ComL family)
MHFKNLRFVLPMILLLGACQSAMDKQLEPLKPFLSSIKDTIKAERLPDTLAIHLVQFAKNYPQHNISENSLYAATLIAERNSRFFECAKWCEMYIAHYPKGKYFFGATVAAAHNYEKVGGYEKAIEYYEKAAKQQPGSPLGKQCAQTVVMLKKGLVTPEQQLEFILNQNKDTADQNPQ